MGDYSGAVGSGMYSVVLACKEEEKRAGKGLVGSLMTLKPVTTCQVKGIKVITQ